MKKSRTIAYWITTILIALPLLSGGIAELAHLPQNDAGLARLGYPTYVNTLLGFWKILGVIAILAPRLARAKEWAYAGIFFDLTGASFSHFSAADYGPGAFHIYVPLILALIAFASWSLRPPSRKISADRISQISAVV